MSTPLKNNSFGFSLCRPRPRPNKTCLICRKNLIRDYSKDKREKPASAPSENNCILSALMNLSGRSPLIVQSEGCFWCESEIKYDQYTNIYIDHPILPDFVRVFHCFRDETSFTSLTKTQGHVKQNQRPEINNQRFGISSQRIGIENQRDGGG